MAVCFTAFMPAKKSQQSKIKTAAARMVRELPDHASWDDLMEQIYVRQKIEAGLADLAAGRTHTHGSIRKEFGLAS